MAGASVTRERFLDLSTKTLFTFLGRGSSSARNHRSGYNTHNGACILGGDLFPFGPLDEIFCVAVARSIVSRHLFQFVSSVAKRNLPPRCLAK